MIIDIAIFFVAAGTLVLLCAVIAFVAEPM
jgi:hypothetical protein